MLDMKIWIISPFECPDIALAEATARSGAYPVLHLGRDHKTAEASLNKMSSRPWNFGVCLADGVTWKIDIPEKVDKIILPWGMQPPENTKAEIVWQIRTVAEAEAALAAKSKTLIIKGSEGAGLCSEESSFILFQKLIASCREAQVSLLIQGGVGIHSAAAYIALGASGIVMDSQVALFPECSLSQERKNVISRLGGNEIRTCNNYHYYMSPGSQSFDESNELFAKLTDSESDILPLGQDVIFSADLLGEYKRLKHLVRALNRTASSHIKQARNIDAFAADKGIAKMLGTDYPIAQGPMARISDVPEFLRDVADGGAMPFLAMSMMKGNEASDALKHTSEVMEGKPWGVGILGFTYPKILEEQTKLILEAKPPFVLIAGGHPTQAKIFEKEGIQVLLHTPTPSLLDMFLKEGIRTFIFEGRESGGHVGPLFSVVLWEKQINRILKMESPSGISAFFAGGIHDDVSAAFIRIMTAPLTSRDVKVGILCGTVYLHTEEIVQRGAISQSYQRLLNENNRTLLLKSGNGQETRCIPSPYTDFFMAEKELMEKSGLETGKILLKLEDLNLGRLRTASKGIAREDGELVSLTESEQLEKGLYMTGEVTSLVKTVTTIKDVHKKLITDSLELLLNITIPEPVKPSAKPSDVAVIGMAGIFPGADDNDELWCNILFGRDCVTEVPEERWSVETFFDPEAKDSDHVVSKWGGFINKIDFDALEFGITPQSLAAIEPVQLLSLIVTKRALEDAGFTDIAKLDLDDTAVIFGAQGSGELATAYGSRIGLRQLLGEVPEEADEVLPRLTEDSFAGILGNIVSGRISNRLNTGGRNFTIDAACASSLAALDVALSELDSHRSDMVVLGGADLHNGIYDFMLFGSTYALSKKGYSSTFDMEADGIAIGEGIGVLILKRLEDAERDGNKIYGVIKGIGASSDGKSFGLTAPSRRGQYRALEQAYEHAGVKPSDVGFIEAHGTGTLVGDRIELRALTDFFLEDGTRPRRTSLGSLKTQIGHTKCASGVAGLIKAVNCVRHGILPTTLHLKNPNEVYTESSPFTFRTEKPGFWHEEKRIAGVSGFGFGGANFHVVLENYEESIPDVTLKAWPSELFVFSGETPEAAEELMEKIKTLFTINNKIRLRDAAYSLAKRSCDQSIQYIIIASTREELLMRIDEARNGNENDNIYKLNPILGKVAFMFSGQGSQRVNMAADLFMVFPKIRRLLNKYPEYEKILFPETAFTTEGKKAQRDAVTDTRNAQPLLGLVDLAIAELLQDFGIIPDMAAGHSYGEIPALCLANAFDSEELTKLSRARAEAILSAVGDDPGRMVAVFADRETLSELLNGESEVWAVNFNTPEQTVLAATTNGMTSFLNKLQASNIGYNELNVACAFHSPMLKNADKVFSDTLQQITLRSPELAVYSNTTTGIYPNTPEEIKERLAKHLVSPVLFAEEVKQMHADGATVFIEAGPGGALTGLISSILKDKDIAVIQTERSGEEGLTYFLRGIAKYIATGRMIDMEKLFEGREAMLLNIDEPETYKKNVTVWNVDGRAATPEYGELPSHAGKPTGDTTALTNRLKNSNISTEQVIMSYLDNMNAMIQDQRDVMLGYLGASEIAPRSATHREITVQEVKATEATQTSLSENNDISDNESYDELMDVMSLTYDQIAERVFDIVSEKTGYPIDMLNLDMDLEADLSIDSIKKVEIVAGLRESISFAKGDDNDNTDIFFEKIISIRTFRNLVELIEELRDTIIEGVSSDSTSEGFIGAEVVSTLKSMATTNQDSQIVRMTLIETLKPIGKVDKKHLHGKLFTITNDGSGLAEKVIQELENLGASTNLINNAGEYPSDSNGLILINSATGVNSYTIFDLFNMLKGADMQALQWVSVFDDTLAAILESDDLSSVAIPEGFSGFIKSLSHEYPDKRFCSVSFKTCFDSENFSDIVIDELTADEPFPEVFYRDKERFLMLPKISQIKTENLTEPKMSLNKDDVIVVLGGAQGITSHVIEQMAKNAPCRYIILGRTTMNSENEEYSKLTTIDEIRKYLIEKEEMKHPREIESRAKSIFKSNQIAVTLNSVVEAGGKAEYYSVDVTDAEAFTALISELKDKYGKIDGVIHAAGILEDKLFRDKDIESFTRVYNTKTSPLKTIITQLLPELKLLAMFSSMSAAFGNAGQCDYAAGNSVLDSTARILEHKNPALRVAAFDWGPWKGAGMVNESLEQEFKKKGISFIELDKGAEIFTNELIYEDEAEILVIGSNEKAIEDFLKTVF